MRKSKIYKGLELPEIYKAGLSMTYRYKQSGKVVGPERLSAEIDRLKAELEQARAENEVKQRVLDEHYGIANICNALANDNAELKEQIVQARQEVAERCLEILCSNTDIVAMRLIQAEFKLEV